MNNTSNREPEYLYQNEPIYHNFVDSIIQLLLDKHISTNELYYAYELANQKYYELLMKECEKPNWIKELTCKKVVMLLYKLAWKEIRNYGG